MKVLVLGGTGTVRGVEGFGLADFSDTMTE